MPKSTPECIRSLVATELTSIVRKCSSLAPVSRSDRVFGSIIPMVLKEAIALDTAKIHCSRKPSASSKGEDDTS
jgi:hypothetical protein